MLYTKLPHYNLSQILRFFKQIYSCIVKLLLLLLCTALDVIYRFILCALNKHYLKTRRINTLFVYAQVHFCIRSNSSLNGSYIL